MILCRKSYLGISDDAEGTEKKLLGLHEVIAKDDTYLVTAQARHEACQRLWGLRVKIEP